MKSQLNNWALGVVPATNAKTGGRATAPWKADSMSGVATFKHTVAATRQFLGRVGAVRLAEDRLSSIQQKGLLAPHVEAFRGALADAENDDEGNTMAIAMFKKSCSVRLRKQVADEGL